MALGAQPLGDALNELAALTGTPIAFPQALVAGKKALAVRGTLTVRQALAQLLAGSGLEVQPQGQTLVIRSTSSEPAATLAPVTVTAAADADGLPEACAGGQVARGSRVGMRALGLPAAARAAVSRGLAAGAKPVLPHLRRGATAAALQVAQEAQDGRTAPTAHLAQRAKPSLVNGLRGRGIQRWRQVAHPDRGRCVHARGFGGTCGHRLKGEHVVEVLNRLARHHGAPKAIFVDNGSEFTGRLMDMWAYHHGVRLDFSRPGKPTDNSFVETFNGSLRDECLNVNWLASLVEAQGLLEAWRQDYNESRPQCSQ